MRADLLITRLAEAAITATANEGSCYPVAGLPARYRFAGSLNDPGEFVARNVGKVAVGIMPHPTRPITTADSSSLATYYDSGPGWGGIWNGFNRYGTLEFPEEGSLHGRRMQGAGQAWEL